MIASQVESAVAPAEAAGFDGDAVEAEAWAYMAVRSLKGLPITFPGTTGVPAPLTGGVLARGNNRDLKRGRGNAVEHYDYIIVGAGSAGAVLAARLTEDPRTSVLLIEAGRAGHLYSRLPISFGLLIHHPGANWLYESDPEPGTANRAIPVPRGKLLGGSSAINGLVWVRGQPLDYDTWAQMGARGWSWQDVAPLFDRIEDFETRGAQGRGNGGPLHVSIVPDQNPLYDALFKAAVRGRLPHQPRLQQRGPGGHRQDPGEHPPRPAHERRPLLPRAGEAAEQPAHRHRGAGAARAARRPALRRHRLRAPGREGRGARQTRGHPLGGRHCDAAAPRAFGHRPAGGPEGARHRRRARAAGCRRELPRPHQRTHRLAREGPAHLLQL